MIFEIFRQLTTSQSYRSPRIIFAFGAEFAEISLQSQLRGSLSIHYRYLIKNTCTQAFTKQQVVLPVVQTWTFPEVFMNKVRYRLLNFPKLWVVDASFFKVFLFVLSTRRLWIPPRLNSRDGNRDPVGPGLFCRIRNFDYRIWIQLWWSIFTK